MKDLTKLINSSICLMPWINISIKPNGNYRLCCLNTKTISFRNSKQKVLNGQHHNLEEVRNNPLMKEYRKLFLKGKKFKECQKCWDLERVGEKSKRIVLIENYWKHIKDIFRYTTSDGTIDTNQFPVIFYDLRLGNLCNAKCLMCGSYNSSMFKGKTFDWANDKNVLIEDIKKNTQHIQELYFAGGEPLINKQHWDLIDFLISSGVSKKIYIRYSSNGSIIKKEFIDKWKQFKHTRLIFSIDGIEDTFEKLREPLKWDKVENNLDFFEKYSGDNTLALFFPTISTVNVFEIPKFIKWFENKKFNKIDKDFRLNFVYEPKEFSIINKEEIYDKVYDLYEPFLEDKMGYYYKAILQHIKKGIEYESNK